MRRRTVSTRRRCGKDRARAARGLCAVDGAVDCLLFRSSTAQGNRRNRQSQEHSTPHLGCARIKLTSTAGNVVTLKSADELALMRRAGRIVAEVLDELVAAARPGITTLELDQI